MKLRIFLLLSVLLAATSALADGDERNQQGMDRAERAKRAAENAGKSSVETGSEDSGKDDSKKGLADKAKEIRDRAKASADARSGRSKLSCNAVENDITDNDAPYPGEENIRHTNNLRRPTGIAINAVGDRIYFTGTLVDSNCVPVQDALVEVWQPDNGGLYSYAIGEKKISKDGNFLGTGRTGTDNEGNFEFLTIFPGFYENRAPHINFRITHPDFNETTGEVFFEYHPRNAKDPYYKRLAHPYVAQSVTLGENEIYTDRNFHIKIPLKGISTYKRF